MLEFFFSEVLLRLGGFGLFKIVGVWSIFNLYCLNLLDELLKIINSEEDFLIVDVVVVKGKGFEKYNFDDLKILVGNRRIEGLDEMCLGGDMEEKLGR